MADVGASLHEEELSDWMSQLFEKLDLEVYEDSISTGKMAQVGTYPITEGGISSEIHGKSQGKDSTMFGKSGLEANEDSIRSKGKVAQVETPPLVEGGIFSEIDRSSEKDSTMTKAKKGDLFDDDEDEYVDWIIKILKSGGHDDILSRYIPDEGEKHVAHYDVPDEFYDPIEMDNATMDNCKSMNRVSKKETINNGIKWMRHQAQVW
ncbi:uncharacterized protein LOC120646072 isoform X2 [Panicum virgatum]|uniref:uncharacterized protein LOC120646072 isoform X2 n=1 Tax=Panicum virgatum TaxID=38727 RepID=UPI0019D59DBB|nr:uncharacterized protein LOC120646072 isoform X2 [Panicum virgatum]